MTNGEKYSTVKERAEAFQKWCFEQNCADGCPYKAKLNCVFAWLDLEAEEEKPLPCPFCGAEVEFDEKCNVFNCTSCNYMSSGPLMNESAVAAHNRVTKAVMESEGK